MQLSTRVISLIKALASQVEVLGEADWGGEAQSLLMDETIGVLDEVLLDRVFSLVLSFAHQTAREALTDPEGEIAMVVAKPDVLDEFIELERKLLFMASLPDKTVDRIADDAKRVMKEGIGALVEPGDAMRAVARLKLALQGAREEAMPREIHTYAHDLVLGLGGASLVLLSGSGLAASLGMGMQWAALSAAVGGTAMSESSKIVLRKLGR